LGTFEVPVKVATKLEPKLKVIIVSEATPAAETAQAATTTGASEAEPAAES
jgi:hypothetical protein